MLHSCSDSVLEQHAVLLPDEVVATTKDVLAASAPRWVMGKSSVTQGNLIFRGTLLLKYIKKLPFDKGNCYVLF